MIPKIQPNPKLEKIRDGVPQGPKIEYDIKLLLEKTKRLHAGWLFDFNHVKLLQLLCIYLDGNFDTSLTAGWGTFGHNLGLSSEILRVIECSKLGNQGYTYYVLQHYAQKDDSTIQRIVQTLVDIRRFDVLQEIHIHVIRLADHVFQTNLNQSSNTSTDEIRDGDSGYYPESSISEESPRIVQVADSIEDDIIKPNSIPIPPLVLRVLKEQIRTASQVTQLPKREHVNLVTRAPIREFANDIVHENIAPQPTHKPVVRKYDCIVLLTFAADGIQFANEVATNLRAKREDGLKFGVIILNEHESLVESNPEDFICGVFPQVNYVIPIITEGYLQSIVNIQSPLHQESSDIDSKYVRFIFTLMRKYFVQNGCLNRKIRCIIPDDLIHLTRKTLMRDVIFESWVRSSSINKLAERMLNKCLKYNNNHK